MLPNHLCRRNLLHKCLINSENFTLRVFFPQNAIFSQSKRTHVTIEEHSSKVFFSPAAQKLMKKLTGFDLEKINKIRYQTGTQPAPTYKFMTSEMLKKTQKYAVKNALQKLKMPPLIPMNTEETEVIENIPELIGLTTAKFVFTDITYNVTDKKRTVVVREPSGILRKAKPFEKHRMVQLYFPKPGREYKHPKMFQKENLERLWQEKEYEFILNRACCQFEPDDREFHEVSFETFKAININKDFELLKSTRHYGTLVFYLCLNKDLINLMSENLKNHRLDDIVDIIQLYALIHPNCEISSSELNFTDEKIEFVRTFIEKEMQDSEVLKALLENIRAATEKESKDAVVE